VDPRPRQKHEYFASGSHAEADRRQSAGPLGRVGFGAVGGEFLEGFIQELKEAPTPAISPFP
jgi:hypothetical protein